MSWTSNLSKSSNPERGVVGMAEFTTKPGINVGYLGL